MAFGAAPSTLAKSRPVYLDRGACPTRQFPRPTGARTARTVISPSARTTAVAAEAAGGYRVASGHYALVRLYRPGHRRSDAGVQQGSPAGGVRRAAVGTGTQAARSRPLGS
jgi:hypothetical protein